MANLLFVDYANNHLTASPFSTADGIIPALNAGTTLDFNLFMVQRSSTAASVAPYLIPNFAAGTTFVMQLRNALGVYARTTSWTRVAPTGGVTVSTFRNGDLYSSPGLSEVQDVTFTDVPQAGFFTLTFPEPTLGWGPYGTTGPLAGRLNASPIAAEINALPWEKKTPSDPGGRLPAQVSNLTSKSFRVDYGSIGNKVQLTAAASKIQYGPWWTGSLVLADGFAGAPTGLFSDLFDPVQGPAYFEILITPAGGGQSQALLAIVTGTETTPIGTSPPPPDAPPPTSVPLATNVYYDGDYSVAIATSVGQWSQPISQDPTCLLWRQSYQQARGNRIPLALDTVCPMDGNAFLVSESEPRDIGGGIIEWDRVWTRVPSSRVEYEMISYPFQQKFVINGNPAIASLATVSLTRRCRVTYDYFRQSDPSSIPLERLPRTIVVNNAYTDFDGFVNLNAGAVTIARDAELSRWMGNIWERKRYQITI